MKEYKEEAIPDQLRSSLSHTRAALRLLQQLEPLLDEDSVAEAGAITQSLSKTLILELRGRVKDHENLLFDTIGVSKERSKYLSKLEKIQVSCPYLSVNLPQFNR